MFLLLRLGMELHHFIAYLIPIQLVVWALIVWLMNRHKMEVPSNPATLSHKMLRRFSLKQKLSK